MKMFSKILFYKQSQAKESKTLKSQNDEKDSNDKQGKRLFHHVCNSAIHQQQQPTPTQSLEEKNNRKTTSIQSLSILQQNENKKKLRTKAIRTFENSNCPNWNTKDELTNI